MDGLHESVVTVRVEEIGVLAVELLCNCLAHGTACVVPNSVLVAEKAFVDVLGVHTERNGVPDQTSSNVFITS